MKKHDHYLSIHGIKNLVPSSLSDQPSRTYKGRLFHFLNETNYFFLKLLSKSFYTELLPTPFFFFFESTCLPVIVRTQLLCMVSKEKETDGQVNFRALLYKHVQQSYCIKKETNQLPFICLLQLFRNISS